MCTNPICSEHKEARPTFKVTILSQETGRRVDATQRRWYSALAASIFMADIPSDLSPMLEGVDHDGH